MGKVAVCRLLWRPRRWLISLRRDPNRIGQSR